MAKPYLFLSKKGQKKVPSGARPLAIVRGSRDSDGDIVYLVARPEEEREDQVVFTEQEKMLLRDIVSEKLDKRYSSIRERERAKASLIKSILKSEPLQTPDLKKVKKEIKLAFKEKKNSEIKLDDGLIDYIPNLDTRECLYIAAPSGSGKSYWCRGYAQQFNRIFPKRKVVLISKVSDDSSLKGIKNLVEMPLELLADDEGHIEAEDLESTLTVFDDTDTFRNKKVRDEIKELKHDVLEIGRHDNVYCLITSHLISNYSHTRTVLNESHGIVFFPSSGSKHQISYVLKNYCGLDKRDISKIYSLNSRWVLIMKHYPVCVVYEKGVYLLGSQD